MNGPQLLTSALTSLNEARTAEAAGDDLDRVVTIYLDAMVEALAALTLATVHPHLSRANSGDWNGVAK